MLIHFLKRKTYCIQRGVTSGEIIGNHDEPEGAFEALLQAIVCKQQIGWRNESRHIIVLATDDYPHIVK